jgi:hypothetical protein
LLPLPHFVLPTHAPPFLRGQTFRPPALLPSRFRRGRRAPPAEWTRSGQTAPRDSTLAVAASMLTRMETPLVNLANGHRIEAAKGFPPNTRAAGRADDLQQGSGHTRGRTRRSNSIARPRVAVSAPSWTPWLRRPDRSAATASHSYLCLLSEARKMQFPCHIVHYFRGFETSSSFFLPGESAAGSGVSVHQSRKSVIRSSSSVASDRWP